MFLVPTHSICLQNPAGCQIIRLVSNTSSWAGAAFSQIFLLVSYARTHTSSAPIQKITLAALLSKKLHFQRSFSSYKKDQVFCTAKSFVWFLTLPASAVYESVFCTVKKYIQCSRQFHATEFQKTLLQPPPCLQSPWPPVSLLHGWPTVL